jgi:hypothetical protein
VFAGGQRVAISFFTLYRVTNLVTHWFLALAGVEKAGRTDRFLKNAQDCGDFG